MKMIHAAAFVLTAIFIGFLFLGRSSVAESRFSTVIPFGAGQGIKLFDQRDGKIYVYDSEMKFVSSYQLADLGQPIEPLGSVQKTLQYE